MKYFKSLLGKISTVHFFYFAVLPALLFQLVSTYLYLVVFTGETIAQYIYVLNKVLLIFWPIFCMFFAGVKGWPFLSGQIRKSILWGGSFGLFIVAVVLALYFSFYDFWYQFLPNLQSAVSSFSFINKNYVLFAVFLSISHSFIEEYFWRWFVVNGLMIKFKKWTVAIIAALFFSLHHFIVVSLLLPFYLSFLFSISLFIVALSWTWIYFKTKSLYGPWLSHFFADAVVLTVGYLMLNGY
jgi:hypothetical protein